MNCPKCGYEMEFNEDKNQSPSVKWWWCLRCGYEEKVKP
jgi:transposase